MLHAYSGGKCLKTYLIALGQQPIGHKQFEGDGKTPEGLYYICSKNQQSRYHESLGITYRDKKDKLFVRQLGKSPGGDVMIHGLMEQLKLVGKLHRLKDWTRGCIAVTNEEIDELFNAVSIGTPIEIRP